MKPSAGYLIPRTSNENLRTSLQIQTQTLDRRSRSSAESFRYQTECSNQDILLGSLGTQHQAAFAMSLFKETNKFSESNCYT